MDERKQLFLMLVQTYAICKAIQDNRGATLAMDVLAEAASIDIERVPADSEGDAPYSLSARQLVNYSMQTYTRSEDRELPPEWTGWD